MAVRSRTHVSCFLSVFAVFLALSAGTISAQIPKTNGSALRSDMRKLWEDHITWTRLYIVSAAANLPDKGVTAKRLLRNQDEIGNAIKPYYGDAAGTKLTGLLKTHIMIATEIIDAAMTGDNAGKANALRRWGVNGDEIATFLSTANHVSWPLVPMKGMMRSHLDLTTQEVVAQLTKDWVGSVAAYDKIHDQILSMADMLSEGIVRQFPQQVR